MIITLELLKSIDACRESLEFFERNGLEGVDRDGMSGDFNSWLDWFDRRSNLEIVRDERGNVVSKTDYYGTYTYTYDDAGHELSVTDEVGNTWLYEYDAATGYKIKEIEPGPDGCTTTWTRDEDGRMLTSTVDGSTWTHEYDSRGNRIRETSPSGDVWSYTYDDANRRLVENYPTGSEIRHAYDEAGREVEETTIENGLVVGVRWTYDDRGNMLSESSDGKVLREFIYERDDQARLVRVKVNGMTRLIISWPDSPEAVDGP